MKLPWPFLPFVSFLSRPREQGVDAVKTLNGLGEGGQFFADVVYGEPLMKLYTVKIVLWTRTSLQNDFIQSQAGLTFQNRQKSDRHNAIELTFMICSVKHLSAASVNCQSCSIIP